MANFFNQFLFIHHQAFKDFKRSWHKKITILVTIFISVFILFVISTLNQSLNQEIRSNTKSILGGDAEIEIKNQILNIDLQNQIQQFADLSLNTTVASMVANPASIPPQTSFVQLRAIDELYPLYGEFITTKGNVTRDFYQTKRQAIINENLAANLQLQAGDELLIREEVFRVHSIIQQMPDLGGAGLFGDLVVISQQSLESLPIQSSENFFEYEYRVRYFDEIKESEGKARLQKLFEDNNDIRVRFPENTTNFLQRTLDNFANFLSLISLAAILIAGIGIANTVIAYINQNYNSIAVQKSLGLQTSIIQGILGYQIFTMTLIISLGAYALSSLVPSGVNLLLPSGLNFSLSYVNHWGIFAKITTIALLAIAIFLLPALSAIQQLSANSLFRNTYEFVSFQFSKKNYLDTLCPYFDVNGTIYLGERFVALQYSFFKWFYYRRSSFLLCLSIVKFYLRKSYFRLDVKFSFSKKKYHQPPFPWAGDFNDSRNWAFSFAHYLNDCRIISKFNSKKCRYQSP
ncbi:hypothetical protein N9M26_02675 [Alphaproteobacteria bacterium]|nr:hypothetical protein [Alphaproteobacteria bacterium]